MRQTTSRAGQRRTLWSAGTARAQSTLFEPRHSVKASPEARRNAVLKRVAAHRCRKLRRPGGPVAFGILTTTHLADDTSPGRSPLFELTDLEVGWSASCRRAVFGNNRGSRRLLAQFRTSSVETCRPASERAFSRSCSAESVLLPEPQVGCTDDGSPSICQSAAFHVILDDRWPRELRVGRGSTPGANVK